MMLGVLDPALLLPRVDGETRIEAELDTVMRICQVGKIEIPALEEYWPDLWKQHGSALERSLSSRRARQTLTELRKRGRSAHGLPPLQPVSGHVYGLQQMFALEALGHGWLVRMTRALARATATGTPTVLITRRMLGRNLELRQAGNSRLEEVTRWVLYLHLSSIPPCSVYCFHHPRNASKPLRWTTRYDWRLPSSWDGARYPFCPPTTWHKGSVAAVSTKASKPAFVDAKGNGWARPNINDGQGHHWDVYIADVDLAERIGLDQLNITAFGNPPKETEAPGSIHHTPTKKQGRLRDDSGWTC